MIRKIATKMLVFYKNNSSKIWLSGHSMFYANCKYHPTCSEYTVQAIKRFGLLGGSMRGVWRVLRCNPFSRGGVDLPR